MQSMKKILLSLLTLFSGLLSLQAAETDSHNNRLYFTVAETADITHVPIILHVENPSINITAVELYFTFPGGVVVASRQLNERALDSHKLTDGNTDNGYFVSIASEQNEAFANNSGSVCTFYCDFSSLADGDYAITASGVFAVGINNHKVTCYTVEDQTSHYTKHNGSLSGIDSIITDESNGLIQIYNTQGMKLREPQKGQINIINGKKVVL